MTKSLKLWKVLGATFLSVGAISISAAAVSHNLSSKADVTEAADYYSGVTDSMTGTTLLNKLNSIINTGSESQNYDWSRFEAADEDPNNSSNVLMIYARTSVSKSAHVNNQVGWNREHTFPQSKLSLSTSEATNAKNDNHIVYASDCDVNGARSNLPMGVVTSGTSVTDSYGNSTTCKKTSSLFDPNNRARGIVARSTMYAAAMYGYDPEDNFESIYTMLKWHLDYPVDSFDTKRNTVVYANQKNRNPFVDHPEYACRIWGDTNSQTQSLCGSSSSTTVSVSLNKSSLSLAPGASETLTATTTGTGTLSWSTSNSSVATVSNGTVTVKSTATAGQTATITATYGTASDTCTVTVASSGSGSGESSGTLTITRNSFSSTASSYAWYDWTQDGVTGKAEIYPATATSMQFNKSKGNKVGAIYNTTALPGSITKIEATTASGTNKSWNAYVTSTACSASESTLTFGSNKTTVGSSVTVSTSSTSFGTSSAGYKYFCLQESDTSASYLSEIKITYNASSSTKTLSSIAVKTAPTKITYTAGEYFAPAGLVITATYSDSSTEDISYASNSSAFTFSPNTSTVLTTSNASVTISYGGKSCSQAITVNATSVTLSSISVSTAPTKTTYTAGETFDPTGLVITRTYSNSTSDTYAYAGHASEFSFSPSTSTALTTANTSVTITYNSKTCSQAITVNASGGSSSSDSYYEKVAANSGLESGKYLIVYETGSVAFNGGLTTLDATSNTISVTISSSKITSTTTVDAAQFTYNKSTNTLKSASGYYIGQTSDSNGLKSSTSTSYENTVSISSGDANVVSGGAYLRYNSANDQARFRYFRSSSYSNQQAVQLYKYVDESASTSASLELNKTAAQLDLNGTKTTTITATASGGSGSVAWASDDPTVATVSASSGTSITVTGKKVGTATITASYNGDCTATCSISVVDSTFPYSTGVGYAMSYTDSSATRYFKGSMSGYYGETSTSISDGMTMYFETNGTGYNLYFKDTSSNKQYITVVVSGTHYNFTMSTSTPSSVWKYDGANLYYTVSSVNYIIGGKGTFGTFSGYLATDSAAFGATFTAIETAETWGASFLTTVTCNNGVTAPSTSAWNTMKTQFEALSTYEQNIVTSTSPNELGSTSLEQALARYAEILSKYPNRTNYPDYLYNPSSANPMNRANNNASSATIILLTVGILSSFAGFAFVGYWLKKKREY